MTKWFADTSVPFDTWPFSERTGGPPASPIDDAFMTKWRNRSYNLRERMCVPGVFLDTTLTSPTDTDWTQVGDAGEIWIPSWCIKIRPQWWYWVEGLGGHPEYVRWRFRFGTDQYSSIATAVEIGAGIAWPSFYNTAGVGFEVPESMKDSVQPCAMEYKLDGGATPTKIETFSYRNRSTGGGYPLWSYKKRIPWVYQSEYVLGGAGGKPESL